MKHSSFTTTFTDAVENLSGFGLDDDYNISGIQIIDSFKQILKGMWCDKIGQ